VRGARIALIGESGSGKSTLLELLAMIARPTVSHEFVFSPSHGEIHDVAALLLAQAADPLAELRSRHIGYVLQYGGLLPYLSVRENIDLSRRVLGLPASDRAAFLAGKLGIAAQLDKLPDELSAGQRQRAAIARALAHEPGVILADEPTAALDPANAERIFALLVELTDALGVTLVVATHAHDLARHAGLELVAHVATSVAERATTVTVAHAD
jgi:putative ABC transport system ATP-binding protein